MSIQIRPMSVTRVCRRFLKEEDGLAFTEYMILLGLLTSVVVAAILLTGANMNAAWSGWAEWVNSLQQS